MTDSTDQPGLEQKFDEMDLLISRVRQQSPELAALTREETTEKASTLSTACTSLCVSTVSTVAPNRPAMEEDPEAARALATLYDRAVARLGQDGFEQVLRRFAESTPYEGMINFTASLDQDQPNT